MAELLLVSLDFFLQYCAPPLKITSLTDPQVRMISRSHLKDSDFFSECAGLYEFNYPNLASSTPFQKERIISPMESLKLPDVFTALMRAMFCYSPYFNYFSLDYFSNLKESCFLRLWTSLCLVYLDFYLRQHLRKKLSCS